ncbi:hypothetical protein WKY82_12845 [Gordonia malaquae]|uniref:hypothetical protein n=1 Tax=Gordonia malaquae TaxID=410332 RepID=UPI0030C79E2E
MSARARTRVGALIAAVAVAGGVAFGAGPASAAPPDSLVSKVGKGFAALVEDNIDSLCMGKEDTGRDDETTTTTTPSTTPSAAPSTSTAPDSPSTGCDINDAELQKAAAQCAPGDAKNKATVEEVSADKDDFLKCMAGEGFGEEDKEEEPEKKDAIADLSLARVGEAMSAFYVNSLAPDGDDRGGDDGTPATSADAPSRTDDAEATGLPAWASLLSKGSTAGAFLAAPDKEKRESSNWLMGVGDAANDSVLDLRAFNRAGQPKAVDGGADAYVLYGATLAALGLDKAEAKDEGAGPFRFASGSALMLAYVGAGSVDAVFGAVLSVMQKLNPFSWLADGLRDAGTPASFTEGMEGSEPFSEGSAFDDLKALVSTTIVKILDLSWHVTVPTLIGFTMIMMLLSRKKSAGDRLKPLIIKVAFIAIGVPLIGATYTGVLSSLAGGVDDAAGSNASKVVLSTLVDFQAWADQRLGLPAEGGEFVWDSATNEPTAQTVADGRRTTLAINAQVRDEWERFTPKTSTDNARWNEEAMDQEHTGEVKGSRSVFGSTLDLIKRYASGEQISAGSFETGVKKGLTDAAAEGDGATVLKWVTSLTDPEKLSKMTAADVSKMQNPLIDVREGPQLAGTRSGLLMKFEPGTDAFCMANKVVASKDAKDESPLTGCNMSPVSMYNYLNSSWDGSTGMKMYSPRDSSSSYARDQHMAVNLGGGGAMGLVYLFSALSLLVSFMAIGYAYCLLLFFGALRRMVTVLGSTPFALLGFQAGIAKVVVTAFGMLLEIIGTMVIYRGMMLVLTAIPTILERPLSERASTIDQDEAIGIAGAGVGAAIEAFDNPKTAVLVITLVSSIGIIIATMLALKVRSALVNGIDEAMSKAINKFMGSEVSSGGPGQPGALRQGLQRGVSMAATSAIMGRASGGGGDDSGDGSDGGVTVDTGEGVPGAGDGSMRVGEDGGLVDASGNPVKGTNGSQATVSGMLGGDGPLTDGSGGEIIGADGSPLTADDVTGFGPNGEVMGEGGQLTDNDGNPLTNANAASMAGGLAGQKAMASAVLRNGLSDQENAAGVPVGTLGNFGGVAPSAAPVETKAAPRPGNLRADGNGGSDGPGVMRQAMGMAAVQAASQRVFGESSNSNLARTVRESMGGSGGQGGSSGSSGIGGLPKKQKPASQLGTTATTMLTANAMLPKRGANSD